MICNAEMRTGEVSVSTEEQRRVRDFGEGSVANLGETSGSIKCSEG